MSEGERRLAAIMYTDIVGYTSLTQENESATVRLLEEHRKLLRPHFAGHGGREVKTIGDAFLVEFQSALDAVLCAVAIQQMMHDRRIARGEPLSLRIGIHVGDVMERGNDILGDAVNVASRIEPLAERGGVCISSQVYDQVRNKSELPFVSLGEKSLKNVSVPVGIYRVQMPWEQSTTVETPTYATNRIAVLPFRNMSPDPNDEYFAEGMTEELITSLSGVKNLTVIARTSVMRYKTGTKGVDEIGRELKVGTLVEGSVRKAGSRIRVTVQVVNSSTEGHLWAQNYDRNLDDIFEVQSDVAKQVADVLRVRLLAPEEARLEKRPTESTAAYTSYLKGRFLWNKRAGREGAEDLRKARECFEQALIDDPTFALGYAGVADCCLMLRNDWGVDSEANLERAKTMVARALELDPECAEARTTKGMILFGEDGLTEAEREFRLAIELRPSYATAHQWFMWVLGCQKRWEEAFEQIEKAMELDPLSAIIICNYGDLLMWKRDYQGSVEPHLRAVALGNSSSHWDLAFAYGWMKRFEEMKREFAESVDHLHDTVPLARTIADAMIACLQDDKPEVRQLLQVLESHYSEPGIGPYTIASLYFYLGENDKGFHWLDRCPASHIGRAYAVLDPNLDMVRTDPRYLDLLKRLGLD